MIPKVKLSGAVDTVSVTSNVFAERVQPTSTRLAAERFCPQNGRSGLSVPDSSTKSKAINGSVSATD